MEKKAGGKKSCEARRMMPATRKVEQEYLPDLQTQLEALLDQVWRSEADGRFQDRIDLVVRLGGRG